jgi:hypothetical protein
MKRILIAIIMAIFLPNGAYSDSRPDLVVTNFNIRQDSERRVDNKIFFDFTANVKNQALYGNANKVFYLSIEKYHENLGSWGRTVFQRQNCYRVTHFLRYGHQKSISGKVQLAIHEISNGTVKLRAYVDSACLKGETPYTYGDVQEKNENNNYSSEVRLVAEYSPLINKITPTFAKTASDEIRIIGHSFGNSQGNHTIAIRPVDGGSLKELNVTFWNNGMIKASIPMGLQGPKDYRLYVADKNSLRSRSNSVQFVLCGEKRTEWATLFNQWNNLFKDYVGILINNWGGSRKKSPNNTSYVSLVKPKGESGYEPADEKFDVPVINFTKKVGHYKYFIRDMSSKKGTSFMNKEICSWNQFNLILPFESQGVETKGFYKTRGGILWDDTSAPDIHINNARMRIKFTLFFRNGRLDYNASTSFKASLRAQNKAANDLMNAFIKKWKSDTQEKVSRKVRRIIGSGSMKTEFRDVLEFLLRDALNLKDYKNKITDLKFTHNEIIASYY